MEEERVVVGEAEAEAEAEQVSDAGLYYLTRDMSSVPLCDDGVPIRPDLFSLERRIAVTIKKNLRPGLVAAVFNALSQGKERIQFTRQFVKRTHPASQPTRPLFSRLSNYCAPLVALGLLNGECAAPNDGSGGATTDAIYYYLPESFNKLEFELLQGEEAQKDFIDLVFSTKTATRMRHKKRQRKEKKSPSRSVSDDDDDDDDE